MIVLWLFQTETTTDVRRLSWCTFRFVDSRLPKLFQRPPVCVTCERWTVAESQRDINSWWLVVWRGIVKKEQGDGGECGRMHLHSSQHSDMTACSARVGVSIETRVYAFLASQLQPQKQKRVCYCWGETLKNNSRSSQMLVKLRIYRDTVVFMF